MESQQFNELIATLKARGAALAAAIAGSGATPFERFKFSFTDLNTLGAVNMGILPFITLPAHYLLKEAYTYLFSPFASYFPPAPPPPMTLQYQVVSLNFPTWISPLPPPAPPPPPNYMNYFNPFNLMGGIWLGLSPNKISYGTGLNYNNIVDIPLSLSFASTGVTFNLINSGECWIYYKLEKFN